MAEKIYYIGYYDTVDNSLEDRNYVLAATNKMAYICSAIEKIGYDVEIVSASGTGLNKFVKGKYVPLSGNIALKLFSTFWGKSHICHALSIFYTRLQMLS